MEDFDRKCLLNRVDLVLNSLKLCNSGCDVHEVGNMRNTGEGIKYLLKQNDADLLTLNDMACRLEAQCVRFFKKKYSHLWKNKNPKT